MTGRPRRGLWVLLLFSGSFVQAPAAMAGMKIKKKVTFTSQNCVIDLVKLLYFASVERSVSLNLGCLRSFLFWGGACKMQHMLQMYVLKLVS